MRFRIVGIDKRTGEAINTIIEAQDKFAALREARDGGVDVAEVVQVEASPIERITPGVIQRTQPAQPAQPAQPMQSSVSAPTPAAQQPQPSQVIYVVERTVPIQMPAAPPPVQAQPVQPHIITHVHVSNNSSANSSPISSSRSRTGGGGCLSLLVIAAVAGVAIYLFADWYGGQARRNRTVTPPAATAPVRAVTPRQTSKRSPAAPATKAQPDVIAAERMCLDVLRQSPDYVALQREIDDYEAKVRASRADPRHPMLQSLSEQWMDAKNRLAQMEASALASDPAVQAAKRQK